MRARFSIGQAAGSGLRLLMTRPLQVIAWGLLYAAILTGSSYLAYLGMEPFLDEMMRDPETIDPIADIGMQLRMQVLTAPLNLVTLILGGMLGAAVIRAVMDRRAPWFRLWKQEVLLIVVQLAVAIGLMFVLIPALVLCGLLGFALSGVAPEIGALVGLGAGAVVAAALIWVLLRLSLIGPASVATTSLAFAEGWVLARGQTGRLLLTGVLTFLATLGVQVVLLALAALAAWAAVAAGWTLPPLETSDIDFGPDALRAWAGPLLALIAFAGFSQAVTTVVWSAPWASAYDQLSAARADSSSLANGSGSGSSSPTNDSETELMQ